MIYEFCAENVTLLEKAMQAGLVESNSVIILQWEEQLPAME